MNEGDGTRGGEGGEAMRVRGGPGTTRSRPAPRTTARKGSQLGRRPLPNMASRSSIAFLLSSKGFDQSGREFRRFTRGSVSHRAAGDDYRFALRASADVRAYVRV
jgi:hypothetical protein